MATEYRYTPEQFDTMVRAYHKRTETQDQEFPDLAGLKNSLGLEDEEYDAMAADPAFHKTCLWAQRRRESYLNRAALTAKNTTGIKMLLAQPENGGYVEKPIDKTPRQIEVRLRGMIYDSDSDSDDNPDADAAGNPVPDSEAGEKDQLADAAADKPGRKSGRAKG
ncbi:MAG: hypothetical protein J6T99_07090 [Oscillospiraceae bacterium]|nr:hypothetical protein [Oscillospiraceae bacterium]